MKALIYIKGNPDATQIVADSAIVRASAPFFPPSDSRWCIFPLRGIRIDRLGKGISPAFADRYYHETITAVRSSTDADNDPLYTAFAAARDGALIVSDPKPLENPLPPQYKSQIDSAISFFSSQITLKTGDLILLALHDLPPLLFDTPPLDHIFDPLGPFPPLKLKIR